MLLRHIIVTSQSQNIKLTIPTANYSVQCIRQRGTIKRLLLYKIHKICHPGIIKRLTFIKQLYAQAQQRIEDYTECSFHVLCLPS